MRNARTAKSSPAIESGPWSAPPEPSAVRLATPDDTATASPVHALQAELDREIAPPAQKQPDRREIALRVAILLYVVGFWWGLGALVTTFIRHLIH